MYEDFYGFDGKPFHLNPEPRFFFESHGHSRALAYLHYGIEQGEGFVVMTGDVGTGKTTLARMLYEELQRSREILVVQMSVPECTANEMLQMVSDAFGLEHERRTKASVLRRLFEFLRTRHEAGKRTLLLVDEVQNLPLPALETLRTLSNLQVGDKALVQIVLLGQAEFRHTLNADTLQQLRQRVVASCHLWPLSEVAETRAYIEHRLRRVGWNGDPEITDSAYEAIHEFTRGTPRRINTFCDRLLLFGFLEECHTITEQTVAAVIDEISSDFPGVSSGTDAGGESGSNDFDGDRVARLEARIRALESALENIRNGLDHSLAFGGPQYLEVDREVTEMNGEGFELAKNRQRQ
ncbi:MAG: XrtA/PEP-CTERM system-associated ATPase [Halofilum sp. (in: g-proteobacteria)]